MPRIFSLFASVQPASVVRRLSSVIGLLAVSLLLSSVQAGPIEIPSVSVTALQAQMTTTTGAVAVLQTQMTTTTGDVAVLKGKTNSYDAAVIAAAAAVPKAGGLLLVTNGAALTNVDLVITNGQVITFTIH